MTMAQLEALEDLGRRVEAAHAPLRRHMERCPHCTPRRMCGAAQELRTRDDAQLGPALQMFDRIFPTE